MHVLFGSGDKETVVKKKLKAICACAVSFSMCAALSPLAAAVESRSAEEPLTEAQIQQRLDEINSSYEIGEAFSQEDEDFVLQYATSPRSRASQSFSVTKTYSNTTVSVSGSIYHTGTISYSYGGDIAVKKTKGKTPQKYKVTVSCVAYGVVGSDGVGKIYDGSVSASKSNADTFNANLSEDYAGVMVAYDLSAKVRVTTSTGDVFTISDVDA